MDESERGAVASLSTLIVLQVVMLAALLTRTEPHPPFAIALFGIAPFLGAALSAAIASIVFGPTKSAIGKLLAIVAGGCALLSFGPQKYFDAQFGLIWPAVLTGQIAVIGLLVSIFSQVGSRVPVK